MRAMNQGAIGGLGSLGGLRLPARFDRKWAAGAFAAVAFVVCWLAAGSRPASEVALPQFLPPPVAAAAPAAPRTGLLPDCAQLIPASIDPAALLAQPSGSVSVRPVIGTPAPAVDLLARTSCTYHRPAATGKGSAGKGSDMLGQVSLSAFATPAAAEVQRQRNVAVEQSDPATVSAPVALGAAHATRLATPAATILMTSFDRYTVTTTLPHGLFPPNEENDVLNDLTRRALASALEPTTAASPPPAASSASSAGATSGVRVSPASTQASTQG